MELKENDFVRILMNDWSNESINVIGRIYKIDTITSANRNINVRYSISKSNCSAGWFEEKDLKLWKPIKGELVWFWDKCTPHRPTLREFGGIMKDGDGQGWYYIDSEQNPYEFCEPFVYDKPSVFKGEE